MPLASLVVSIDSEHTRRPSIRRYVASRRPLPLLTPRRKHSRNAVVPCPANRINGRTLHPLFLRSLLVNVVKTTQVKILGWARQWSAKICSRIRRMTRYRARSNQTCQSEAMTTAFPIEHMLCLTCREMKSVRRIAATSFLESLDTITTSRLEEDMKKPPLSVKNTSPRFNPDRAPTTSHPPRYTTDRQDAGEFPDNSRAARSASSDGVRPRMMDSKPGGRLSKAPSTAVLSSCRSKTF